MKFHETSFEDYIKSHEEYNFNEKNTILINNIQTEFNDLSNLIIYGPPGTGKYTQCLNFIKKYSESGLKYEKKMLLNTTKNDFYYKISDIHYEIDIGLLGCNSKQLWNELFDQIVDIISAKRNPNGFIVCKNFHTIQVELLEIFYSYIQKIFYLPINIKFILLTEHYSFIPENIISNFVTLNNSRPSKNILKKKFNKLKTNEVTNLKDLYSYESEENIGYELYDTVLENIINYKTVKFSTLRENLYNILIYNISVNDFLWYILKSLIARKEELNITNDKLGLIMDDLYSSLQLYNNNYRPIYHLEKIVLTLIKHIHE